MIDAVVEQWHQYIAGDVSDGLESLLADDVVFYSPIVFTPQRGKDITTMYLLAAKHTLGATGDFRYTKEVRAGDTAMLEFETTLSGTWVNGIDIIRCNPSGLIVEFRVMIRPLRAVNLVHEQMRSMLASMQGTAVTA